MDAVTAATIALAVVGGLTFLASWRMANATQQQAEATVEMLEEILRDRELAYRPYLMSKELERRPSNLPRFEIINAGRGPALTCRGILYDPTDPAQAWFETDVFQLGPDSSEEQEMHSVRGEFVGTERRVELRGLGDWGMDQRVREILICTDIFGKQHRFQPEVAEPEVLSITDGTGLWIPWFQQTRQPGRVEEWLPGPGNRPGFLSG